MTANNFPEVIIICDGQFGSTGKGLIAGYLAEKDKPDTTITAWSPNAGHTYVDKNGRKFVHCMLANGIVSPNLTKVMFGPGTQMNIDTLLKEIENAKDLLTDKIFVFHRNLVVVQERHIQEEAGPMVKIGSTRKGCGAAIIEKIRRNPDNKTTIGQLYEAGDPLIEKLTTKLSEIGAKFHFVNNAEWLRFVCNSEKIQVEGAQGYSLGINSGFYPYCTSRECSPAQIIVDCAVPPYFVKRIVGSIRTFPIRVANRYNEKGEQIGWSGPCYDDQTETTFDALGLKQELTTVTKLPRRIFTFSDEQMMQFLVQCGPSELFLNFCNYLENETQLAELIERIESIAKANGLGTKVRYLGFGAKNSDVLEKYEPSKIHFRDQEQVNK